MKFDKGLFVKSLLCGILCGVISILVLWLVKKVNPADAYVEALSTLFITFAGVYIGLSVSNKK